MGWPRSENKHTLLVSEILKHNFLIYLRIYLTQFQSFRATIYGGIKTTQSEFPIAECPVSFPFQTEASNTAIKWHQISTVLAYFSIFTTTAGICVFKLHYVSGEYITVYPRLRVRLKSPVQYIINTNMSTICISKFLTRIIYCIFKHIPTLKWI